MSSLATYQFVRMSPAQKIKLEKLAAAGGTDASKIARAALGEFLVDFERRHGDDFHANLSRRLAKARQRERAA